MVSMNREFWALPVFAGIALAYAAWLQAPILWFLVYVCLGCGAIAMLYRWRNWRLLEVSREFYTKQKMPEAGQPLSVELIVKTSGWLPWPWLGLRDVLPPALVEKIEYEQTEPGGNLVWAGSKETHHITYEISNLPRGIHRWHEIDVRSGDPLGLVSYLGRAQTVSQLVVYPRTINLLAWKFFPRRVDGAASAKNSLHHDLSQLVGVREYSPGDRLSLIHWKSTAKTGQLYSKEFSPMLTETSLVLLDCSALAWQQKSNSTFEEAVTVAASLVRSAWIQRIPVQFHGNQGNNLERFIVNSQMDYQRLLLHLTTIRPTGWKPLSQAIPLDSIPQGGNFVVISADLSRDLQQILYRLSARGNVVTVIQINDQPAEINYQRPRASGTLNIFTINKADDLVTWVGERRVSS